MKKVVYFTGIMLAMILAVVNVLFVIQDERNALLPVEETQAGTQGNGVGQCDPIKYQVGYREHWDSREAVNGYLTINGESRYIGHVGGGGEVEINVQVPVCVDAPGNCCDKEHLKQDFKII